MRRREFITLIGGAASAWPLKTRAQQPAPPTIGFLGSPSADDPEASRRLTAFAHGLEELGWTDGHNVHLEVR